MNGKEKLWWAQDARGHCYLTTPESPLKPGFQRFSTTTPSEMDRIYAKLSKQEEETYSNMTRRIYEGRKEWLDQHLSDLRTKIANSSNPAERDVLIAWQRAFEGRMSKLMQGTVYGVAEIQKREAVREPERTLVTADEIRQQKQLLATPSETETIQ